MLRDVRSKRSLEAGLAVRDVHKFDFGTGQVDRRRAHKNAVNVRARLKDVRELRSPDHHVVRRRCSRGVLDAESARGVTLRVGIDDKHRQTAQREACGEIDGRGCLADPALLIGDRDDVHDGFSFL